jgi:hydrogenase maturation factor
MVKFPDIGKISQEVFDSVIYPRLGAKSDSVLVGPQHGVDVGIVRVGDKAVALTSDPVFIVPEYGFERAAWFAVHILVSDVVTSGLSPTYLTVDLNLPMEMTEDQFDTVWEVFHRECERMGMAIVAGHTARYENCHYPMVGGATLLAVGDLDRYVSPSFIRPGDRLVITKGPAIEATGIFATMFPERIAKEHGEEFARECQDVFFMMSVYEDAMTAVRAGIRDQGVSALHDATECGIYGAAFEMAQAAGLGVTLDKDRIETDQRIEKVCKMFGIDPFKSISEGTLLVAVREPKAGRVVELLKERGIPAFQAGEFTESREMSMIEGGEKTPLIHPKVDPFWAAFYRALKEGA